MLNESVNQTESKIKSEESNEESKKSRASQKDEDMEKISVVGSRIRRLDMVGPSPVHIITKEAIEKSGYNLVGTLLRDSTLVPYGESNEQISVRGLGPENTLVLVNGKRLPKRGSFYGSRGSNVNALPTSAIERVEVLTDGASAIYGSEALSSVINIITRKDLNGVSASSKLSVTGPKGGDVLQASLTYGRSSAKGHMNTSFEYLHGTSLFAEDLSFTNKRALKMHVTSDNYSTPGVNRGRLTAFDSCQERNEMGWCTQYHGHINRSGVNSTISNFSELSYLVGPDLTFKSDIIARYNRRDSYSPTFMRLKFGPGEGPSFESLKLKGFKKEEDPLFLIHRVKGLETCARSQSYTFGANIGVEGDLNYEDWVWSINNHSANYSTIVTVGNLALKDASKRAMRRTRQYNPFNSRINYTGGMLHDPDVTTNYFLNTLELAADGTLVEVGETSLSMAVGLQLGYYGYKETADPQVANGNTSRLQGVSGSGHRLQQSAYVELGALFSSWIEAQLATRFDNYSDFGSTVNPKLALKVQPIKELMLRGSVGTGFRAPELADVNMGPVTAYLSLKDEPKCAEDPNNPRNPYCSRRQYETEAGGNPDLQEEASFSYNIELGIEPISSINFSVGYWYYKLNNVISRGGHVIEALRLQAREGLKPEDYGVQIIRDDNGEDDIDRIIARNTNLGVSEMDGLDLKAHVNWGSGSFHVDYSMVLRDHSAYFEGYGFQSELGNYGFPRYRYTVTYNQDFPQDQFSLQIKRRTSGSYKDEESTSNPSQSGKIPSHSQYDVFFRWNQAPFDGELTVGAINVLNSLPKSDPNASPHIDTALYRGFATYYVGYKARF